MRIKEYKIINEEMMSKVICEKSFNYPCDFSQYDTPQKIGQLLNDVYNLKNQAEEYVYLLCFDKKMHLIGLSEISHGSVDMSVVSTRSVYLRAMQLTATQIVIAHNHPGKDTSPSNSDIQITKKLVEAGNIMDIPLVDHIIIADNSTYSMKTHYPEFFLI